MPTESQDLSQGPTFGCSVTCPNCISSCPIDWAAAVPSGVMGYDLQCPTCGQVFNFISWLYESACPDCGQEFATIMHNIVSDDFVYRWMCDACGQAMDFQRNTPPQLREPEGDQPAPPVREFKIRVT